MGYEPQIRILFDKYLRGECSLEEVEKLYAHFGLDSNDPNLHSILLEYFNQPSTNDATSLRQASQMAERALPHIEEAIERDLDGHDGRKKRRLWLPIAAAILSLATISAFIVLTTSDRPSELSSQTSDDVLPGGNRAILTLADGSTISLSEDKEGISSNAEGITYTDGTDVLKTITAQYATLTTPRAGQYQITLPDGSKAWLNAESSLRYPTAFVENERRVELTGEAYFEIAQDEKQPFIVQNKAQQIRVLGTHFNVNAYDNETALATTLVAGSIMVSNEANGETHIIMPGQQTVLHNNRITINQVDVQDYTAWKDGLIVLNRADLPSIFRQIERWYDVEFVNASRLDSSATLSGEIPRNIKLSGLLQALEEQTDVKFELTERRIMVLD